MHDTHEYPLSKYPVLQLQAVSLFLVSGPYPQLKQLVRVEQVVQGYSQSLQLLSK